MIVVDASVIVVALGDDGDAGRLVRRRLRGERLSAPEVIDLEVLSAWRRLVAAGALTEDRALQSVGDLVDLRVRRVSHRPLMARCWELRSNVTAYDAAYVALAERLDTTLVTVDGALAGAPGPRCPIELLTAELG